MLRLRYILTESNNEQRNSDDGHGCRCHHPACCFRVAVFRGEGKRDTMLEIAKHIDDPKQLEQLVSVFNEEKEPIDYRRGGVIAVFVGLGIFMLGYLSLGLSSRELAPWSA